VLANLTLASSRVELGSSVGGLNTIQTNDVRPLTGQSPFVVNVGLDYAREQSGTRARLVYNVAGRRLAQVGSYELPDVYEQPRHQLDLTLGQKLGKHVDLKATAENLLDSPVLFTQGEDVEDDDANTTNRYTLGRTFGLGVTVSY
jgi:outer membrane receptor protein involved in Fe transport